MVEEWPYRLLACVGFVTIALWSARFRGSSRDYGGAEEHERGEDEWCAG